MELDVTWHCLGSKKKRKTETFFFLEKIMKGQGDK